MARIAGYMYLIECYKTPFLVHKPACRLTFETSAFTENGDFDAQRQSVSKPHLVSPTTEIRQSQVFHGFPNYPSNPSVGAAMAPALHDGMGALGGYGGRSHTAVAAAAPKVEDEDRNTKLFGNLPEAKRRKFLVVDDPDQQKRVRVRVMLENSDIEGAPDDFRHRNCVYPRSFINVEMPREPSSERGNRFYSDDDPEGGSKDDGQVTIGRTLVPVSMLEGEEREVPVPRLSRAKKERETLLNELGYRMAWVSHQTKTFDRRTMFLQRARTLTPGCCDDQQLTVE